jgi:hypothetical protein
MYGRVHARTLLHGLELGNFLTGSGHGVRHVGRGLVLQPVSIRRIPLFCRLAKAGGAAQGFMLIPKEHGPISDFCPYMGSTHSFKNRTGPVVEPEPVHHPVV